MPTFRRIMMIIGALLCVGVTATLLAACSSGAGTGGAATNPATAPATDQGSSTAGTTAPAPAGNGSTVTAKETEFAIALSAKTLKAGSYTFDVENAGQITHALTINGPGLDNKSTEDIAPGKSATLTVTLKAGTYDVYCPVGDHKMEGMDETLKVS